MDFFKATMDEDAKAFEKIEKFINGETTPEFVQKWIDGIAVRINLLTHLNIDFIEEYKKNIIHQETRED